VLANATQRRTNRLSDSQAYALSRVGHLVVAAVPANRGGQLVVHELELLSDPLGALSVVHPFGFI
jgi:hypothetical protein